MDQNTLQHLTELDNRIKKNGLNRELNGGRDNFFELKGQGINRWNPLFYDPQKNCIEPFSRIGDNTVLHSLDQHVKECDNK
jgi:hypothetical protein|tara:strand:+ start:1726 stop:1968 length:243 start_codon:yes stop_codon:yes gene_type:complete